MLLTLLLDTDDRHIWNLPSAGPLSLKSYIEVLVGCNRHQALIMGIDAHASTIQVSTSLVSHITDSVQRGNNSDQRSSFEHHFELHHPLVR